MKKKKKVLLISFIILVMSVIAIFSRQIGLCPIYSYSNCAYFFDSFFMILFPIIPLFVFSLITYKMQDSVFQAWWSFARIWIPISMLAILVSPSNTHNWMFPIEKGTVAFFSSVLFAVISLILIIIWQVKEKKL
jgi:hypothetical protein